MSDEDQFFATLRRIYTPKLDASRLCLKGVCFDGGKLPRPANVRMNEVPEWVCVRPLDHDGPCNMTPLLATDTEAQ